MDKSLDKAAGLTSKDVDSEAVREIRTGESPAFEL
jgi:hypothetical protein